MSRRTKPPKPPKSDGGRRSRGAASSKPPAERAQDIGELTGQVRLQKVLARAGVSSRRGAEALIAEGRIKVNGQVVTTPGTRVDPVRDRVSVDGKLVEPEPPIYLVLNKPDESVCSTEKKVDERGRATVISFLRGIDARVFPVGRLDYHTRGVLLITNDGEFASRLLHPRHKVPRTYHVKFQGRLDNVAVDKLRAGVTLEDGTVTQPVDELLVIRDTETNTWVQMTLSHELNRQIRRMGEAVEHPVLKLIRVAFGDVTVDDLPEGQFRQLREPELGDLRSRTGLSGG